MTNPLRKHAPSDWHWLVTVAACSLFALCGTGMSARGAPTVDETSEPAPPDDATICRWIEKLAAPSYRVRGAAQAELMRAGEAALERIAEGARSMAPERRVRCVDILRRHAAGNDRALALLAQSSLEELSKSDELGVARSAVAALAANARRRAADEAAQRNARVLVRAGGGMILVRPAVRPRAVKRVAVERSVRITNINGQRTIVAKNGDRRVDITDGGDDGIKVTITDKVDGKQKKQSFSAKDAKTLKEKHPQAYKEYEKYAKRGDVGRAARREAALEAALEALDNAKRKDKKQAAAAKAPRLAPPPKLPPPNHVDVPAIPAVTPQR